MSGPSIEFTEFQHKRDTEPVRRVLPLANFIDRLRTPDIREDKNGKAIALATFNGGRKETDVATLTGWALDFDTGALALEDIAKNLNGYAFAIHSTHTHQPEHPKYRAFVFFDKPVAPTKAPAIFAHLQGKFGGALDETGKKPEHIYFLPSCPPERKQYFEFFSREGALLDATSLPDPKTDSATAPFVLPAEIVAGERNSILFAAMCSLIAKDLCDEAILAAIRIENQARVNPPLDEAELRMLLKSARKYRDPAHGAIIAELNAKHFAATVNGHFYVVTEDYDVVNGRHVLSYSKASDFELRYANRPKIARKTVARHWLESSERREYKGIAFMPSGDVPPSYYNLWRGFAVEPADGDCSLYLRHILDNVCRGDPTLFQYVVTWMADGVQNPTRRPGTALVTRGKQGTGKGTLGKWYGALFGQHFLHVNAAAQILGQFNSILRDALVVFADEAFWAGDKSHEGAFKRLITEDTLVIEAKFQPATVVPNYVRLIVASNHDWVVPAGLEERRVVVLDVADDHMQDHAYFAAIERQMRDGGLAALLKHLQGIDVDAVDLRKLPVTAALIDQKLHSLEDVLAWWASNLYVPEHYMYREEEPRGFITSEELYNDYAAWVTATGRRRKLTPIQFGMQVTKLLPEVKPHVHRTKNGVRRGRLLPRLADARKAFAKQIGGDVPWPADE